jgi:tetratricopeptide (TPR) repeat protein
MSIASLPPWLAILLVGSLYLAAFAGLAVFRHQRLSVRLLVEGGVLTAAAVALCFLTRPPHPILFLAILYVLTMRVRLLVDAANLLANRGRFHAALRVLGFALRLGADPASRQIALINRGVTQLRMGDPQAAYFTLRGVLEEPSRPAARYRAAGFYNLGVACERTGRTREAERSFRQAIEAMPSSIYALGADKALKRAAERKPGGGPGEPARQ